MGSASFKSALANDKDPAVKELHSLTLENTRENQKGFHGATTPRKNERGRRASEQEQRKVSFKDMSDDFVYDKLEVQSKRLSFSGISCECSSPLSRRVSDMLCLVVFPSKSKIKIDKWHLSSTADSGSFRRSTPEFRPPPIDVVSSPVGILRSPENAGDKLGRTRWLEDMIVHELNKSEEEEAARRDVDGSQSDRQDERNEDGGTSSGDRKQPAGRTAGLLLRESEVPLPSPLNRTLKKEGVHIKRPLELVEEQEHVVGDASKDSRIRAVEAGDRKVRAPRSPVVHAWTDSIRGEEEAGKQGGRRDFKGSGRGSSQEPVLSAGRDEELEEQEGPSPAATSPVVELRPSPMKSSSNRRNLGWNDKTVQSLEYRPFYWFW